jgi:hypothetical protein
MADVRFSSWYATPLRAMADGTVVAGRLQGHIPLQIADLADISQTRSAPGNFELLGPGDVGALTGQAITRRFPAPGVVDAEDTKVALVELRPLDLPWRYSPEVDRPTAAPGQPPGAGRGVRPWMAIVVGTRAPDDLTLTPDHRVTIGPTAQDAHLLAWSWQWAHLHEVHGAQIARIVSPRQLQPNTDYTVCVVPTFVVADDGTVRDAWPTAAGGAVTLPYFDSWSFRTGPDGDFPELAAKLHPADLAAIAASSGKPFGRAKVQYHRRGLGNPAEFSLDAAGALRLPPLGAADPADDPPPGWVETEVAKLSERIISPDGRAVVSAPRYHEPFTAASGPPGNWIGQLTSDPRRRGAAGLGAWNGIAWQDRISDAAAAKSGDLAIARDRLGHLALGLAAARSLWRRRVPTGPVERLAVLGPVLGRLPVVGGGTVADSIDNRTPRLPRALWSSAARRALRPGPARTALAADGAAHFAAVLAAAAQCPARPEDAADIPIGHQVDPDQQRAAIKDAVLTAARDDQQDGYRAVDALLHNGNLPEVGMLAAILDAIDPGGDQPPDQKKLSQLLDRGELPPIDLGPVVQLTTDLATLAPVPCRPVDLVALAKAVSDAVDPSVDRPVVIDRVLSTLPGITSIGPVELEPELDLPLWSFLSQRSPDWLLPGAGDLPQHSVVGLSTNPPFVEALLAGANQQTLGELRWRNVPMTSGWTPLRKFWQRPAGQFDIRGIKTWPPAASLGDPGLADGGRGAEAVVVFRTPLFRRYPSTVVYLYALPAPNDWTQPDAAQPMDHAKRIDFTFTGTIGDDLVYFGFPVPPGALKDHWVVLEEPPSGYRFYHQDHVPPAAPQVPPLPPMPSFDTAAHYAYGTFALPVRVLIGPLLKDTP